MKSQYEIACDVGCVGVKDGEMESIWERQADPDGSTQIWSKMAMIVSAFGKKRVYAVKRTSKFSYQS